MPKVVRFLSALTAALSLAACSHAASAVSVSPGVAGEVNAIQVVSHGVAPSSVELDMPDMAMRPEPYPLTKTGKDVYEAQGVRFSMAGSWRINVLAGRDRRHIATFTIIVK